MAFLLQLSDSHIDKWHDCYLSETKKSGYVATFERDKKKHNFYGLNDLNDLIVKTKRRGKNVYLSLNAFEYGSRKTKDLKQIRNIGVDIDCYKVGLSVEQAVKEVRSLVFKGKIPHPNLVIYSGRGIQLVYSIAGGASPDMVYLSRYITNQFTALLAHIGADSNATGPSRVFRLPGSVNSKNGVRVTVDVWNEIEFTLEELYLYCTPLEKKRKVRKTKRKGKLTVLPAKGDLLTVYSLNTARKDDLDRLVELRQGNIENRNDMTYIYAYTVALILKNKESTIQFALQLNDQFDDPQPIHEVVRTAGNGYDDAMKFFGEFQKRNCVMWYALNDGFKKPMKNDTLIDILGITEDELKEMTTVITPEEKQARDTENKRKKRGSVTREEYLEQQKDQSEDKLWQLKKTLERYPNATRKELAGYLSVSPQRISQLRKLM